MTAAEQPYFQTDFPPEEFAARRARVAAAIGGGAVAVLRGGTSTGAFDVFRQTNEFYYLSGVEAPHSCLLIRGGSAETTLYLLPGSVYPKGEGKELNADEPEVAIALTGVNEIKPLEALAADLRDAAALFTPFSPAEGRMQCRDTLLHAVKQRRADPWEEAESAEERFRNRLAGKITGGVPIRDLSPILDELRLIKSPAEVAVMRRAGHATAEAVLEAMRITRPGMIEFELGAVAEEVYVRLGARGGAYRAIIAAGANIWNGHYYRNNCALADGELVLMDYAPDIGCYTSDIGRMWPVNGRYTAVQRELYGFIVDYHKVLLELIRPGRMPGDIHREAADRMRPVVEQTRWSKPAYEAAARRSLDFKGHLSHPVGMAVHDVGRYTDRPLQSGTVFALDPQMWIPEEMLYIRVEDTVAITDSGLENLTAKAPLELDDVERTMANRSA